MTGWTHIASQVLAAGPTEGGAEGTRYGAVAIAGGIFLVFVALSVLAVRLLGRIDDRPSGRVTRGALLALGLLLLLAGQLWGLVYAPPEQSMGEVGRILYVHVPSVWLAMVAMSVNFAASVVYLFRPGWRLDALAEASAEWGLVLGANGVLLGAIWGRPTWGVWWDWDPRLTSAAIMLILYAGYLALRKFVEDPEKRAVWSAVVGIVAFVDLPIVWFSVKWWRSLHQVQSSPSTMSEAMQWPLRLNAFAFLFLTVAFIWFRYRTARRAREEELAPPPAALPPAPGGLTP